MTIPTTQSMTIINTILHINDSINIVYTGLRSYDSNLYTVKEEVTVSYVNKVFLSICKMMPLIEA
jgi:hypothetical protein